MVRIRPGSKYFVGREALSERLLEAVRRTNAVLLFGGRQAGKTALLLEAQRQLAATRADVTQIVVLDVPVYVDLTSLPYDAEPGDFFGLLAVRAADACKQQISGFAAREEGGCRTLDAFADTLLRIRGNGGEVDIRLVFLLDEAKRVLSERFPRGFQDNLFTLLFGQLAENVNTVMVFAGAQHLNEFNKDDTSPIGSRAIPVYLSNLTQSAIQGLVALVLPDSDIARIEEIVQRTWEETGGHAGLAARFLERVAAAPSAAAVDDIADRVFEESAGLFQIWTKSLTLESQVIALTLVTQRGVGLQEAARHLKKSGLNQFAAAQAFDQLVYTGVAVLDGDRLRPCNQMFWKYYSALAVPDEKIDGREGVWAVIEETELALRQLIGARLAAKYGQKHVEVIRRVLGEKAWAGILGVKERSEKQYKFSRLPPARDPMSCMYLGQLGALMMNNETWELFRAPFRDKREFEDKLAAIAPVRNDCAHFCSAPDKELERCRIACDDLLVIVERELAEVGPYYQQT